MKKDIYDIVFSAQFEGMTTKEATDKILVLSDGGLSFEELKSEILKYKAKSEYQQAAIVMLRNIFENKKIIIVKLKNETKCTITMLKDLP